MRLIDFYLMAAMPIIPTIGMGDPNSVVDFFCSSRVRVHELNGKFILILLLFESTSLLPSHVSKAERLLIKSGRKINGVPGPAI